MVKLLFKEKKNITLFYLFKLNPIYYIFVKITLLNLNLFSKLILNF
jgi:hypothetical protein